MAGLGIGGGSLSLNAAAGTGTGTGTGNGELPSGNGTSFSGKLPHHPQGAQGAGSALAIAAPPLLANTTATTMSGFAMLGLGKKYAPHSHHHQHHQHQHRHSLTTRHRVLRTRSSGGNQNVWDEQMMEVSGLWEWSINRIRVLRVLGGCRAVGLVALDT